MTCQDDVDREKGRLASGCVHRAGIVEVKPIRGGRTDSSSG